MWQKGHYAKDCFSKTTSEPSYKFSGNSSSGTTKFQPKILQSSQHFSNSEKPKIKDFEAKYRKAKAKLENVTLQIQNSEFVKQNHALQEELKKEKDVIASWTKKILNCMKPSVLFLVPKGKF